MGKFAHYFKKKLFATYEYNEKLNKLESEISILMDKKNSIELKIDSLISNFTRIESLISHIISEKCSIEENLIDIKKTESKLNLISRNTQKYQGKIKIVFLVNNINAWYAISDVVTEMKKRDCFEVIIASINKKFPGQKEYTGESDVHDFFATKKIEHIRLGMSESHQALDILLSINPNVIFRQSQWDIDYPPHLSSMSLSFTKLAIIPYGIVNIIKNVKYQGDIMDSAVDSEFHRRCWKVYCSSDYVKKNAKENGSTNGRQFFVSGHPKIDYLEKIKPINPFNTKNSRRVLWSPHHSIMSGWSNFGMFIYIWKDMLDLVKKHNNIDFIFCPHPALVTQLKSESISIEGFDYEKFVDHWSSLDNGFAYFGAEYAEISSGCDLIITDGISMLMECQIMKKNILFIERNDHVEFNNIGKVLTTGFFSANSMSNVESMMLDILNGKLASLSVQQELNINELFPRRNSPVVICDDIEYEFSQSSHIIG